VCRAKRAGETNTFIGPDQEGADGEWSDIRIVITTSIVMVVVVDIGKTTGGKIETIYEIVECVESFRGEDAPWLLLLLALLICHGA